MPQITLRGFFKSYDQTTKKLTFVLLSREIEKFTYDYLHNKSNPLQINPLRHDQFYVKSNAKSRACLDREGQVITPISGLLDQVVNLTVTVYHYNFKDKKTGKKVVGWSLTLVDMHPHRYA
jgi:hypothetical protein